MQRDVWRAIRGARMVLLLAGVYGSLHSQTLPAWGSTTWAEGDVFVGVSNGSYQVYDNAGVFKETISHPTLSGRTAGCAFNPALDRLYTTYFAAREVVAYDDASPHSVVQTIPDPDVSGFNESIVFAANGDFYVGHPLGGNVIHQYDAAGTLITTYAVASAGTGTDQIDLAANQTTLFYTGEGRVVKRFDTVVGQLADFTVLPGDGTAFALRLLPPGDGSGGLLVADRFNIKRLDSTGTVVQTYDVLGEDRWFALNLDPNGTSFWSGDFRTANFYRFNIDTGAIEVGPINTGTGASTFFGLCVKGELTAAIPLPGRITLTPPIDFNPPGTDHTVTSNVANFAGQPLADTAVTFDVLSGPNVGTTGSNTTDVNGDASFTYTSNGQIGLDEIQASFVDASGETLVSTARKYWDRDCQPNGIPDTCDLDCTAFNGACAVDFPGCGRSSDSGRNGIPDECFVPCDIDGDGDVDRHDIQSIFAARNNPASGPGDPRDVDGDGMITVNDARKCTLRCDLPRCAPPTR